MSDRTSGTAIAGDQSTRIAEARPKQLTHEMRTAAATEIANRLISERKLNQDQLTDAIRDIADQGRSRFYIDGYSLARDLETQCGWECDLQMAETLDGYGRTAREQIEAAEKEWAKRTNPQPPLPIGTRINLGKELGEITGLYKYGVARYEVKIDCDPQAGPPTNSRRIILFEDAKAAHTEERTDESQRK